MEFRRLGRTGLEVSSISVGTEHLRSQPRDSVTSVIDAAIDGGVNYFDVVFSFPEYLDNLGVALGSRRGQVLLTGHLGSTVKDNQYCRNRSPKGSEPFFRNVLARLKTDYVDVLYLHNFNSPSEWDAIAKPGGLVDLALRLRDEGHARFLGISGHRVNVMRRAIESGHVDVIMFPVSLLGHALPARRDLLDLCARKRIGVVAMKPYGGGKLLKARGTQIVTGRLTGGESFTARFPPGMNPAHCLSYTLAQVGVSTALIGVKDVAELRQGLETLHATGQDSDFSGLISAFGRYVEGECVYCNHCLPCPEAIDIAEVNRLLDAAEWGLNDDLRLSYAALAVRASECSECGACAQRCPFGVEVILRLRHAVDLFER